MTLFVYLNGVDVSSRLRLEDGFQTITSAADGTYATSGLKFDDPNGDLTISAFQQVVINETACSRPRLFTGYVIDARPSRGPYKNGVSRVWNVDAGDLNVLLHLQALHTSDAKRPQETGTARVNWLLGTTPGSYVHDDGKVAANTALYDAADYHQGTYPDGVLPDVCETSSTNKVFFVYWNTSLLRPSLYVDVPSTGTSTSSLAISNVLSDVDEVTTFPPNPALELTPDMSEIYDEVLVVWAGGQTFASNHDGRLPSGIHRTGVFETPRIGHADTAATHGTFFLAAHAGQIDVVNCPIQLPADKVNLIDAGMLVSTKFEHIPNWASFTNRFVARRTVNLAVGTNQLYDAVFTLGTKGVAGTAGGGTSGVPQQPVAQPGLVQHKIVANGTSSGTITLDSVPGEGNLLVAVVGWRATAVPPSILTGFTSVAALATPVETDCVYVAYRIAQAGDTATFGGATSSKENTIEISEWSGAWGASPVDTSNTGTGNGVTPSVSITPTAGLSAVIIGGAVNADGNTPQDSNYVAGSGYTLLDQSQSGSGAPLTGAVYKSVASTTGAYSPNLSCTPGFGGGALSYWAEIAVAFKQDASLLPPAQGQWVYQESPTMSGASGTTAFPFATGSLRVYVDLTDQTGAITAQNGAAGTFTLGFIPKTGESVTVDYQGR